MNMIYDVLKECGYAEAPSFRFTYQWDPVQYEHRVIPCLSEDSSRDPYLTVSVSAGELPHLLDSDFMPSLMGELGRQPFFTPSMNRNITLVMICRCDSEAQIDHEAKVRLEDDPYYFKKYVFAYSEQDAQAAERYIAENRKDGETLIGTIRGCLLNPEWFAGFKAKTPEHSAYAYFAELATKVTVLPIQPDGSRVIKTVQAFLDEELENTKGLDVRALDSLLKGIPDEEKGKGKDRFDADKILAQWQALKMTR